MLLFCGADVPYMMKSQIRVDVTLRFEIEGYSEGNKGKTIFSFDIHIKYK